MIPVLRLKTRTWWTPPSRVRGRLKHRWKSNISDLQLSEKNIAQSPINTQAVGLIILDSNAPPERNTGRPRGGVSQESWRCRVRRYGSTRRQKSERFFWLLGRIDRFACVFHHACDFWFGRGSRCSASLRGFAGLASLVLGAIGAVRPRPRALTRLDSVALRVTFHECHDRSIPFRYHRQTILKRWFNK